MSDSSSVFSQTSPQGPDRGPFQRQGRGDSNNSHQGTLAFLPLWQKWCFITFSVQLRYGMWAFALQIMETIEQVRRMSSLLPTDRYERASNNDTLVTNCRGGSFIFFGRKFCNCQPKMDLRECSSSKSLCLLAWVVLFCFSFGFWWLVF